jgi:hypothetical protein
LTGKQSEEKKYYKKKTRKVELEESKYEGIREQESRSTSSGSGLSSEEYSRMITMKNEVSYNGEFWGLNLTKVKEEVGGGGYLGGFSDLEGFISEINGGFPLFPLDHATHNMQGFEQHQLL